MAPNILGNTIVVADAQIEAAKSSTTTTTTTVVRQNSSKSMENDSSKHDTYNEINNNQKSKNNSSDYRMQIVWLNVILMCYLHASALYGLFLVFTKAKLATNLFGKTFICICAIHTIYKIK